jgi:hypothetical protein
MPPTQAQLDEVGVRIRQQAATKSIEELIAIVDGRVKDVDDAANGFSPEALTRASSSEDWTPLECLSHLIESNATNAQQILYVALSGELPADGSPEVPRGREQLLASHRETIDSLFEHVRQADPDAYLDVRWPHQFFGELNWREWLIFLSVHCSDHLRQLKAMQSA